jgi:EAL domain-containing protein (putative c-di-GMP-specific phosphodiesterase class I)
MGLADDPLEESMSKGTLMHKTNPGSFDLQEVIECGLIESHFQPIVSLKRKRVVGYEGLSRGIHPVDQSMIPPTDLFAEAGVQGLQLELDRLCRKKAMESFRSLPGDSSDFILTLNLDASVMDQGAAGSGHLRNQVMEMGLNPRNIAIEIIESNVEDMKELQKFVHTYRGYGFLIALDDVGAGHSNLNRIPLIKPDILKIDRYLIQDIQEDFYKQEVLKSLLSMARHLGTLIIAEGVETEEESMTLLDMGVDMVQGYFFAKPLPPARLNNALVLEKVERLGLAFKQKLIRKIDRKRFNMDKYYSMILEMQIDLEKAPTRQFDLQLAKMISKFPQAEALYVLDETGLQVTDTVFDAHAKNRRNPVMFHPALKGSDHTLKDYFYFLMETDLGKASFVTKPYLSMASGNVCVTLSALFKDADQKKYILCIDINTEGLSA